MLFLSVYVLKLLETAVALTSFSCSSLPFPSTSPFSAVSGVSEVNNADEGDVNDVVVVDDDDDDVVKGADVDDDEDVVVDEDVSVDGNGRNSRRESRTADLTLRMLEEVDRSMPKMRSKSLKAKDLDPIT